MNRSMTISKMSALFFLLLGLFYTIMTFQLENAVIGRPYTPKIFPAALGVLMIGLSIGLLVKESRAGAYGGLAASKAGVDIENLKQIGLTAVCALLYAVLFNRLGYIIATILFLEGVLSVFNGLARWKQNTIVAVVFSVIVYVLFSKLFNVYLPPLPFGG